MIRPRALVLALLLAGCAEDRQTYPSLALRPVEGRGFDEPVRAPVVVTPDPALDSEIVRQGAELDRIAAGFAGAADAARKRVGAAARVTVGSEAWLDAQAALARVDDWRSQEGALAAAIEALGSARAAKLQPPYPALDALAARAAAEADREQATAEQLQRALPAA